MMIYRLFISLLQKNSLSYSLWCLFSQSHYQREKLLQRVLELDQFMGKQYTAICIFCKPEYVVDVHIVLVCLRMLCLTVYVQPSSHYTKVIFSYENKSHEVPLFV